MKHRLPILPAIVCGMLGAVAAGIYATHSRSKGHASEVVASNVSATATAAPVARANPASTSRDNLVPTPPAGDLIQQVIQRLASHDTLSAKISLSSGLFGESLIATGQYLQGPRDSRRLRLELKVKLGDKACSLQQVSDGQALWIQQTTLTQSRLSRVDVPRAVAGLQQTGFRPGVDVLALGGLPALIDSLNRSFDFQAVRSEKLGNMPTYVVLGVWKQAALGQLMPDQKQAIDGGAAADLSRLPVYTPNQVEIYIGRDDLFTYQVDYLRAATVGRHSHNDNVLARVKFVDVHFDTPIDPAQFVYQTRDAVPVDDTDAFLQRMQRR